MRILFFLLMFILICCVDQSSGESAAKDLCECLRYNGSPEKYEEAFRLCDQKMIDKYHYYKLFEVDMASLELYDKLSDEEVQQAKDFMHRFYVYQNNDVACCRETMSCKKNQTNMP